MNDRGLGVALVGAAGVAAVGLIGLLGSDGPYLSLDGLSPWSVVYAIGIFALLLGAPFALHRRIAEGADRDRRWELAIVVWGGIALAGAALFAVLIALAGGGLEAAAVIGLIECGLVVGAVATLMLTTG